MIEPLEAEVEGVHVRITRRTSEPIFDVAFLHLPTDDAPAGYSFARYDDDAPLDRVRTLHDVAETIRFLRGKGLPL